MNLSIEEFQMMSDEKSEQAIRIAMLERQVEEKTRENEMLLEKVKMLEMSNAAEQLTNIWLRNYIMLSVGKVKVFLTRLTGFDHFAFLKTFLEFVLPPEHYQEQLMLVNEVMAIPEEPRPPIGEMHNHFEAGSGCQVFNEKVVGQFDR